MPALVAVITTRFGFSSAVSEPLQLLSAAEHLPGIEADGERGMGKHVGVVRVAGRLSGDARHPDDPWLQDSLAAAAREADPQLQSRPSADRPFLLGHLQRRGWRPDGVEGWVAGLVKNDAATLWRTNTVAGVLRYPSHILLQVTMPLALSAEGESLDYDCAYEWMVVRETVAALAFLGSWFAGFPAAAVARDQLRHAVPELSTHENQRVTKALNDSLQAALVGLRKPEQALEEAQEIAVRLLRPFR